MTIPLLRIAFKEFVDPYNDLDPEMIPSEKYRQVFYDLVAPRNPPTACKKNNFDDTSVFVAIGDSLTHGGMGYSWVDALRRNWDEKGLNIINAGRSADYAWNTLQKMDDFIDCKPKYVTVLIGYNDTQGVNFKDAGAGAMAMMKLPRLPSRSLYLQSYEGILQRLKEATGAKIAIITMPPFAGSIDSPINKTILEFNEAIGELGKQYDMEVLDLHAEVMSGGFHEKKPQCDVGAYRKKLMDELINTKLMGRFEDYQSFASMNGMQHSPDCMHFTKNSSQPIQTLVNRWLEDTVIQID